MTRIFFGRLALLLLPAAILLCSFSAAGAANDVAASSLGRAQGSVHANHVKPAACAAHDLSGIVAGSGAFSGTPGNDLILGGPGMDTIDGAGGDDCILGGGGDDTLTGGSGNDTCIGGPGDDVIDVSCE
jgi:Ca2+-binding RTX toxin-like protein